MEADPKKPHEPRGTNDAGENADEAAGWGAQAVAGIKEFGVRVFVHIAALFSGVAAALVSSSALDGLCAYAGLICIAARGMSPTPGWLVPAASGVAQAAVLAVFFGFSPPHAVFWGGAQSWLQRLAHKRLDMGGEWGALLLLLPIGIALAAGMAGIGAPLFSFCCVLLAGRGVALAFRPRRAGGETEKQRAMPPEPEKVTAYRASLASLDGKIARLPRSAQTRAASIAASAGDILKCMAADPRDLEPGHRFLNRYLKAVHTVTDKHIRLARESSLTPEILSALAQSEDMLARLEGAFAKEHERLLANDIGDFSADLAVLDTLLKMDGK